MIDKQKAIEILNEIISENKNISLGIGEIGSAVYKQNYNVMTPIEWKHIGYVSALSEAFDITQKDIGDKDGKK